MTNEFVATRRQDVRQRLLRYCYAAAPQAATDSELNALIRRIDRSYNDLAIDLDFLRGRELLTIGNNGTEQTAAITFFGMDVVEGSTESPRGLEFAIRQGYDVDKLKIARWRLLTACATSARVGIVAPLAETLRATICTPDLPLTHKDLLSSLHYLESAGLIKLTRQGEWSAQILAAGRDVVEGLASACPPGIYLMQ